MNKTIITIWGNADTGKSSTIKNVYALFKEKYKNMSILYEVPKSTFDITNIIKINEVKIGIESQGDPNSNLFTSLKLFHDEKCELIICATRTKGNTVNEVMKYERQFGYDVIWLSNLFSSQKEIKDLNNRSAELIQTLICDILKGVL